MSQHSCLFVKLRKLCLAETVLLPLSYLFPTRINIDNQPPNVKAALVTISNHPPTDMKLDYLNVANDFIIGNGLLQ